MPRWNNPSHWHLTYKQGLHPVSRQPEVFHTDAAAREVVKDIAASCQAQGCRVKVYALGIRAYDCRDAQWSDRSFEIHGCTDWECDTIALDDVPWTSADRRQYLEVLQERGLVP